MATHQSETTAPTTYRKRRPYIYSPAKKTPEQMRECRAVTQRLIDTVGITINPELQSFLPKLTDEEFGQLEKNLLADPDRIVLVIWEERGDLLDGHHRYEICQKHNLPFEIKLLSLPDIDAAKLWMIEHQLGQRNLTDDQRIYWLGKHYELKKQTHGGQLPGSDQNGHSIKTRKQVAEQHKVGEGTVERAAQFARAVDTIAANVGNEARAEILDGDLKLTRQETQQLAEIAEDNPQTAKNVLVQIKSTKKPQEKKRIVQEASRRLPKPAARAKKIATPVLRTDRCDGCTHVIEWLKDLRREITKRRAENHAKRNGRWHLEEIEKAELLDLVTFIEQQLDTFNPYTSA